MPYHPGLRYCWRSFAIQKPRPAAPFAACMSGRLVAWYRQDRAGGVAQYAFGGAAAQSIQKALMTSRGHHDQIRVAVGRGCEISLTTLPERVERARLNGTSSWARRPACCPARRCGAGAALLRSRRESGTAARPRGLRRAAGAGDRSGSGRCGGGARRSRHRRSRWCRAAETASGGRPYGRPARRLSHATSGVDHRGRGSPARSGRCRGRRRRGRSPAPDRARGR